ncbi:MAG: hypothetical protein U0694_16090 [Anaerolineae bacterium]
MAVSREHCATHDWAQAHADRLYQTPLGMVMPEENLYADLAR